MFVPRKYRDTREVREQKRIAVEEVREGKDHVNQCNNVSEVNDATRRPGRCSDILMNSVVLQASSPVGLSLRRTSSPLMM